MTNFDPREAALRYAAQVEEQCRQQAGLLHEPVDQLAARQSGPGINAVACGLVYVGDEIEKLRLLLGDALPLAGRGI